MKGYIYKIDSPCASELYLGQIWNNFNSIDHFIGDHQRIRVDEPHLPDGLPGKEEDLDLEIWAICSRIPEKEFCYKYDGVIKPFFYMLRIYKNGIHGIKWTTPYFIFAQNWGLNDAIKDLFPQALKQYQISFPRTP